MKTAILIKKRRKAVNLTQHELGKMSGMSNQFISNIERGQALPPVKRLKNLALALGIDVSFLKKAILADWKAEKLS